MAKRSGKRASHIHPSQEKLIDDVPSEAPAKAASAEAAPEAPAKAASAEAAPEAPAKAPTAPEVPAAKEGAEHTGDITGVLPRELPKTQDSLAKDAAQDDAPEASGVQTPATPTVSATPQAPVKTPTREEDLAALETLELRLYALHYALGEIGGLGPIIDPPAATEARGVALSELTGASISQLTDPACGELLDRLAAVSHELAPLRQDQIRILKRDRDSLVGVPVELNTKFTKLTCEADDVWRKCKLRNDWKSFEGYLDQIVGCALEIARAKDPEKDPYDVWLNEFEWGATADFYQRMFDEIKACVVPLLKDCMASPRKPDTRCVQGSFDEERQWKLAEDLLELEGLNKEALWLGRTEHPFTSGPSRSFVVVAGHAYKDNLLSNVYSILHEGGHALYEQNVDKTLQYTSLSGGTSMGMHESQSRLFENIIGRSEAFSGPLAAVLRKHFPGPFSRVAPRQIYRAANCAEPGLIRTEADELTYPLHVMIRFEIERALFAGEIKAADVPGVWAAKYQSYLGVSVPDFTRGPLQDSHWAGGSLGYFPTYAYGSAIGCQLKAAMIKDGVDFDGACAAGNLSSISAWLKEKIWRWGRRKDSAEIIEAACGESFSAHYYTDYLTEKFSSLYELKR